MSNRNTAAGQVGCFRSHLDHLCRQARQTYQPPRPRHRRLRLHKSLTA